METSALANLPRPPYYAVIFSSRRTAVDDGYQETARRMLELAARQPGYLGVEHARDAELGITVSYWRDEESIRNWRRDVEHIAAQDRGRSQWYEAYEVRVAKVERSYGFQS
ncbi:antibiotic biosynthesis monooxygenase family protein [Streptoalloteichus hindustanus]|uniref:Heme-degrading monooxygenase HmoA n=1 Tax=Streptoalloteichus hindustanus TaxID=2017 RepID=A0A1M5BTR4_STRHI|nr:antibiotic biosynthesis monooxygenase [Streptoalloteichus hindustanus]SHF45908.1 Heme-degrading monooxygenase HmoA [Streptoalloteichus hindustanus]